MTKIYLFTGEECYTLDKEIQRRKDGFQQKIGADSIFSYSSERFDPANIMQNILGGGLFVTQKLIIIKHIPIDAFQKIPVKQVEIFTDSFIKNQTHIPSDVIIVFISYKPDKRTKFYKFIEKNATEHKEFPLKKPNDAAYKTFVKQQTPSLQWDAETIEYMLAHVGSDFYRLESELSKLSLRAEIHSITTIKKDHIDMVVYGAGTLGAYELFDYIFVQKNSSLKIIDKMRDTGSERGQALGSIYRGVIMIICIIDMYKNGVRDANKIAQNLGYHPFSVSKQLSRIQQLLPHEKGIHTFYSSLVQLEVALKTGEQPHESFRIHIKDLLSRV